MVMSNQIDNLFKKKLEAHSMEPGPGAWKKISSSTSKKNKAVIWFRAAAALLLMASALWLFNNTTDNRSSEIAKVIPEKIKTDEPVVTQKEADKTISSEENNVTQTPVPPTKKSKVPTGVPNNEKAKNEKAEPLRIDIITETLETVAQIDSNEAQDDFKIDPSTPEGTAKPIVIVYELKSYAKTAAPEPEMESLLQKKNGLKKVLDVANNIRTGESSLGGLRQAKEDLFALNFKKEDKKNNR